MATENLWMGKSTPAAAYEEFLVPSMFRPWGQALVDAAAPRPGEHVLDVACGTGIIARLVAPRVTPNGSVVGVDLNAGMLAVARTSTQPEHGNIRYVEADLLNYRHEGPKVSLAVCQQGLQFIPEKERALGAIHSSMAPGGRLAVSVWRGPGVNRNWGAFIDSVGETIGPEVGRKMMTPFGFDDAKTLRNVAQHAGFKDVHVETMSRATDFGTVETFVKGVMRASPIAPDIAKAPVEAQQRLAALTIDRLRAFAGDGPFRPTMQAHILTGKA